jgi:AcrR family transcriptional regulator
MSVSHLLYYFESKEAVLEELCRKLNARFLAEIAAHSDDSAEQRLAVLVDHIFTGRGRPREVQRLIVEMIALSMHRPKILEIITEFNHIWLACLTSWFQQVPRPSGISAEDAAVRIHAVLTGLANNTQFDARLDRRRVRRLYRQALSDIVGASNSDRQTEGQRPGESPIGKETRQAIARSPS